MIEERPEDLGFAPAAVADVVERVESFGATAQLCVLKDGRVLLDRSFGVAADTPFVVFSAGKPLLAVLVHQLAERGELALDDPIAAHWPGFRAENVTVRQVLQHRSGLPYVHSPNRDALIATSWGRSVRALERARPHWPPGEVPAYHVISFGFLLGELAQRVTKMPLWDALRERILGPLGLRDTYLGTPRELWGNRVRLTASGLGGARMRQVVYNRRVFREAVMPAATFSSTARDLARFYQALLDGGPVLGAPAVAEACRMTADDEVDRVLRRKVRWSQGFQLGGGDDDPGRARQLGTLSTGRTFGHNGSNACLAWADPDRRLVVAYLTNRMQGRMDGSPHQCEVSDALFAGCR